MSTRTTLVCGLGDHDSVTFIEENGERRVTELTGAPLECFQRHAGTLTVRETPITIWFDVSDNNGKIDAGSRFGLYFKRGSRLDQKESSQKGPFFSATVITRKIDQFV